MSENRNSQPADIGHSERSNPMLMRVLAAIVGILMLVAVVITLTTDSGWQAYSDAWVGIIVAYICIAYTFGSVDPINELYRKITR